MAMSARATASICCSPPDIVPAFWVIRSRSRGNSSSTRSRSATIPSRSLRRNAPRSRFSDTVIRGKIRRPSGDWAIPRRTISSAAVRSIRLPSNVTCPWRGRSRPEIVRSVVDLPAPLDPMSVTISPGMTVIVSPFTAAMLP